MALGAPQPLVTFDCGKPALNEWLIAEAAACFYLRFAFEPSPVREQQLILLLKARRRRGAASAARLRLCGDGDATRTRNFKTMGCNRSSAAGRPPCLSGNCEAKADTAGVRPSAWPGPHVSFHAGIDQVVGQDKSKTCTTSRWRSAEGMRSSSATRNCSASRGLRPSGCGVVFTPNHRTRYSPYPCESGSMV